MSFFTAYLYDKVMAETEAACLQSWRQSLLNNLTGRVLEMGAGTGANLGFYNLEHVTLTLCEPDASMRKQLNRKIHTQQLSNIQVNPDGAERIHTESNSMDYVVSTLVCCSVGDLSKSLMEVKRILKPGGKFVFLEHVAAPSGTGRRTWQNMINPVWRKLAGNCHLNRHTEQAILDAGFSIKTIERESMRKAMPLVRPSIRGVAIK